MFTYNTVWLHRLLHKTNTVYNLCTYMYMVLYYMDVDIGQITQYNDRVLPQLIETESVAGSRGLGRDISRVLPKLVKTERAWQCSGSSLFRINQ